VTTDQVMTTDQVADALGVGPQRVRALLKQRADFPRPAMKVGGAYIWDATAITEWAATADRSVGRPKKDTTQR
jgi:predicted DNA-binding transcriptional regulator AlpA